jgi:hypothetical protein
MQAAGLEDAAADDTDGSCGSGGNGPAREDSGDGESYVGDGEVLSDAFAGSAAERCHHGGSFRGGETSGVPAVVVEGFRAGKLVGPVVEDVGA